MIAEFTKEQPQYRYMKIDERVDVIVFKYIETKTYEMPIIKEDDDTGETVGNNEGNNENVIDGEKSDDLSQKDIILLDNKTDLNNNEEISEIVSQVVYVYEVNQFTCDKSITEDMIKNNIEYYLKYQPKSKEESLEDLVKQQREQINNLSIYLLNK